MVVRGLTEIGAVRRVVLEILSGLPYGSRFCGSWLSLAARRKEEVDAAGHRQKKREATRLGNLLSQTGV